MRCLAFFHQTLLRILAFILPVNLTLQVQKSTEINDWYTQWMINRDKMSPIAATDNLVKFVIMTA